MMPVIQFKKISEVNVVQAAAEEQKQQSKQKQ